MLLGGGGGGEVYCCSNSRLFPPALLVYRLIKHDIPRHYYNYLLLDWCALRAPSFRLNSVRIEMKLRLGRRSPSGSPPDSQQDILTHLSEMRSAESFFAISFLSDKFYF